MPDEVDFGWIAESIYLGDPPDDLQPDWLPHLKGSPDQIAESLRHARDLGISVLFLFFRARDLPEYLDQLGCFGTEVLPLLSG